MKNNNEIKFTNLTMFEVTLFDGKTLRVRLNTNLTGKDDVEYLHTMSQKEFNIFIFRSLLDSAEKDERYDAPIYSIKIIPVTPEPKPKIY